MLAVGFAFPHSRVAEPLSVVRTGRVRWLADEKARFEAETRGATRQIRATLASRMS